MELSSALFRQRPLALQARCGGTHFELGVLTNGTTPPVLNRQRKGSITAKNAIEWSRAGRAPARRTGGNRDVWYGGLEKEWIDSDEGKQLYAEGGMRAEDGAGYAKRSDNVGRETGAQGVDRLCYHAYVM